MSKNLQIKGNAYHIDSSKNQGDQLIEAIKQINLSDYNSWVGVIEVYGGTWGAMGMSRVGHQSWLCHSYTEGGSVFLITCITNIWSWIKLH